MLPPPAADLRHVFDPGHPVCRGEHIALVFSGPRTAMLESAGEPTWACRRKYLLPDPRCEPDDDLAGADRGGLPRWPAGAIRPIDGVCFVLSDADHPVVEVLRGAGGRAGAHYVLLDDLRAATPAERCVERLRAAWADRAAAGVVILGYGHQGRRIARLAIERLALPPADILVVEHGAESRRAAEADGVTLIDDEQVERDGRPVIYSPLQWHDRLATVARSVAGSARLVNELPARRTDRPLFGPPAGKRRVALDDLTAQAVEVGDDTVALRPALRALDLPLELTTAREVVRRVGDVEFVHLHAGDTVPCPDAPLDVVAPPGSGDFARGAGTATVRRVFVTVRGEAIGHLMAARAVCAELWPHAVGQVLPATAPADLGSTGLERLLRRHVGRCEVAMASQTTIEQVSLGAAAAHYAPDAQIIEIGSSLGGSALLLAAATPTSTAPVISIDPDTADRDVMRFVFEREGFAARLDQRVATSDEAIGDLRHLSGRAGLVLIDGLHGAAAARRDLEHYAPLVRSGGALLVHDVVPRMYGVWDAFFAWIATDGAWELRLLAETLAVVERRSARSR